MAGKPVSEVLTEAKAAVQELKAREAAAEQVPEFLPEGGAELALSAPPADRSVTTARKTTRRPGVNGNAQPGGKPRLMVPPNKGAAVAGKGHAKGGVKSGKHAAGRRFPLAHKPAAADMPALEEQPARNGWWQLPVLVLFRVILLFFEVQEDFMLPLPPRELCSRLLFCSAARNGRNSSQAWLNGPRFKCHLAIQILLPRTQEV